MKNDELELNLFLRCSTEVAILGAYLGVLYRGIEDYNPLTKYLFSLGVSVKSELHMQWMSQRILLELKTPVDF